MAKRKGKKQTKSGGGLVKAKMGSFTGLIAPIAR